MDCSKKACTGGSTQQREVSVLGRRTLYYRQGRLHVETKNPQISVSVFSKIYFLLFSQFHVYQQVGLGVLHGRVQAPSSGPTIPHDRASPT